MATLALSPNASPAEVLQALLIDPQGYRKTLRGFMWASGSKAFPIVSNLIGALYALIVGLSILALAVRLRHRNFWLVRSGRPNAALLAQICIAVFAVIQVAQVWGFWSATNTRKGGYAWQVLGFVPIGFAGYIQVWGAIQALPHRRSLITLPHTPATSLSSLPRVPRPVLKALIYLIPFLLCAPIIYLAVRADQEHTALAKQWYIVDGLLEGVDDGASWSPKGLQDVGEALVELREVTKPLMRTLWNTALILGMWWVLDILVFLPCVYFTLRLLSSQIAHLRTSLQNAANLNALTTMAPTVPIALPMTTLARQESDMGSYKSTSPPSPRLEQGPDEDKEENSRNPANEVELKEKLAKFMKTRRVFVVNVVAWALAMIMLGAMCGVTLAGGYVGAFTKLSYHEYILFMLWYPPSAFLFACLPTSFLFLYLSFPRTTINSPSQPPKPTDVGRSLRTTSATSSIDLPISYAPTTRSSLPSPGSTSTTPHQSWLKSFGTSTLGSARKSTPLSASSPQESEVERLKEGFDRQWVPSQWAKNQAANRGV